MKEVSIIGVDLAKNVFQLHGAAADGTVQTNGGETLAQPIEPMTLDRVA